MEGGYVHTLPLLFGANMNLAVGSYYSAIVCTNTSGILLIGLTTEIIHNWTRNNLS